MSNLQTYYHFKLDFQKVDQHTGGKWLIAPNLQSLHRSAPNAEGQSVAINWMKFTGVSE